jgi:Ca2+-binding RTX toxin-like protein
MLTGAAGADDLYGGPGADSFIFKALLDPTVSSTGRNTTFDFSHAQGDRIKLSSIDANTAKAGDQSFLFKGTAEFSGTKGELRYDKQASDTYVYGDVNGDRKVDFAIHLDDAVTFVASDFLL